MTKKYASEFARKGGLARAAKLTAERRHEIALKAGLANPKKWKEKQEEVK